VLVTSSLVRDTIPPPLQRFSSIWYHSLYDFLFARSEVRPVTSFPRVFLAEFTPQTSNRLSVCLFLFEVHAFAHTYLPLLYHNLLANRQTLLVSQHQHSWPERQPLLRWAEVSSTWDTWSTVVDMMLPRDMFLLSNCHIENGSTSQPNNLQPPFSIWVFLKEVVDLFWSGAADNTGGVIQISHCFVYAKSHRFRQANSRQY
jgi:hypothetical protein